MQSIDPDDLKSADQVRRMILSGGSLGSLIGFALIGAVSSLFLLVTFLHGLDAFRAIGRLGPEIYLVFTQQPQTIPIWLAGAPERLESLRGTLSSDPLAWGILLMLAIVLMVGHYRRYQRPQGQSLLTIPAATDVATHLLSVFGSFRDIAIPLAGKGMVSNDFFSLRGVFYAPKGQVSRIIKGKPSENQQRVLRFFMAHEYAHAVARDNLANSVFQVAIRGYVVAFLVFAFPLVGSMSVFLAHSPGAGYGTLVLAALFTIVIVLCVIGCFYGMLISYLKAREFFADRAAFALYPDLQPYGSGGAERPDLLSAFNADISRYERALHKEGFSLHARNMLVFFWGFAISVRTLYLLVVPTSLMLYVFLFDAVALVSLGFLYVSMPKRPPNKALRPMLPWLVSFITILALFFSGPGLLGVLKMVQPQLISDLFGQVLGLPLLVLTLVFLVVMLVYGVRRLIARRSVGARGKGRVLARLTMHAVMLPGLALDGLILCLFASLVFGISHYFLSLTFVGRSLVLNCLMSGQALVLICVAYWQYRGLFARFVWVYGGVAVIGASVFAFGCVIGTGLYRGVGLFVGPSQYDWQAWAGSWAEQLQAQSWTFTLSVGVLSAILYLMLRLVAFWARGRLIVIEKELARVRYL
nr:M48 family metalloprotease [uncultured Cohaesibacter sp.]